jgi:primosomal protein N' (replication factor Y)
MSNLIGDDIHIKPRETTGEAGAGNRARVLLPLPLRGPYDYLLPPSLVPQRGLLVRAPFGKRDMVGVVWDAAPNDNTETIAPEKLRQAEPLDGHPILPTPLCDFIDWVAGYTLSAPGAVLAQALRVSEALLPETPRPAFIRASLEPARQTPARARVLDVMKDGLARELSDIAELAQVSPSVVKGLAREGALINASLPEFAPLSKPNPDFDSIVLSPDQARAASSLREQVAKQAFGVSLLDGVTGSGKTETYFEAVAEALARNQQVLILLPEIALTVQFLERFAKRFGAPALEWHSELGARARRRAWRAVRSGEARVVAGARSALFLPFSSLGLIVVDEEHEQAYKQEEGVIYHARDMAVVRARIENCPIILSSATPSLETYVNAKSGRYQWLKLEHRHGAATLPEVRLVDMRVERGEVGEYISPPLREALRTTLAASEQALLFLNRRGYAPLTLCAACGHKQTCVQCSAWLVEHRARKRLVCHHCGYETRMPEACPQCQEAHSFIACGPGVERLEEELRTAFPEARIAIASSDTFAGARETQERIRAFAKGEIDVLIGTQIVAKGHHFPSLTLAAVIDADLGGMAGDPRAAERSFQLLQQVAGRAGRAEKPGLVLIQTRNPDDKVMQALAANNRDDFYAEEIDTRQRSHAPPFGRLAAIILAGPDGGKVRDTARALAKAAPRAKGISVWGPSPAFYQMLRGKTRERLLVQSAKDVDIQAYLRAWLAGVSIPSNVRLTVDVDPVSFF